jgi:hypothetical protein
LLSLFNQTWPKPRFHAPNSRSQAVTFVVLLSMIEDLSGNAIDAPCRSGAPVKRLYIADRATVCRPDQARLLVFVASREIPVPNRDVLPILRSASAACRVGASRRRSSSSIGKPNKIGALASRPSVENNERVEA